MLEHLERDPALARPAAWPVWWERYVESRPDYQSPRDVLAAKLLQAGQDARDLLDWAQTLPEAHRQTRQMETLRRVSEEHIELTPELMRRPAQPARAVHNPLAISSDGCGARSGNLNGMVRSWSVTRRHGRFEAVCSGFAYEIKTPQVIDLEFRLVLPSSFFPFRRHRPSTEFDLAEFQGFLSGIKNLDATPARMPRFHPGRLIRMTASPG